MGVMQLLDTRSSHVLGVMPRSMYGHNEEARAWLLALQAAQGRPHPTPIYANGRILGVTQGRWADRTVRYVRFRPEHRFRWSVLAQLKEDMLYAGWTDVVDLRTETNVNGKYGRTHYLKTATTAPVANNWADLWGVGGTPTSGAINGTAFTAVQFSETTTGAITHHGNVSTDTKHLLKNWVSASANNGCLFMLYDRVLAYDQCTFNASASQAMTNTLAAQRYVSGAPGLLITMPVNSTATGATAANLTALTYTNQAGTTSHAMPTTPTVTTIPSVTAGSATRPYRNIAPITSGATVPWTCFIPLAQSDTGCRLVDHYTTSAANTGTFTIVLMAPLTDLIVPLAGSAVEVDTVFQRPELPRIFDGACLSFYLFSPAATALTLQGNIDYGWG